MTTFDTNGSNLSLRVGGRDLVVWKVLLFSELSCLQASIGFHLMGKPWGQSWKNTHLGWQGILARRAPPRTRREESASYHVTDVCTYYVYNRGYGYRLTRRPSITIPAAAKWSADIQEHKFPSREVLLMSSLSKCEQVMGVCSSAYYRSWKHS